MNSSEYNTSNSAKYNVKMVGGKDFITLTKLPDDLNCDMVLASLITPDGKETNKQKIVQSHGKLLYPLNQATAGNYSLQVMRHESPESSWYVGWISNIPIQIKRDRTFVFEESPVYVNNVSAYGQMKKGLTALEQYKTMPRGDNADIIRKAYQITLHCYTDYSKALAIHDWIADNVYYDFDSYYSKSIDYSKLGSAAAVYRNKLAVCCGYSDLAVIMLRAVGIPAYSASCYALGVSTDGTWTRNNIYNTSNHAVTMAFIQNRWVIMDITWDSGNKFEGGRFQQTGPTHHRYFDPTLQSFSNTHKLCA